MKYNKDGFPKGSIIFQEVGGEWRRVDSQEPNPPTLAEFLKELGIIIDDYTEFARIKQPKKLYFIEYMAAKLQLTSIQGNKIKTWLYRYNILVNGKHVECNLLGWKTALAHARKRITSLFDEKENIIEILNLWTGEIIDLKTAEKRAAEYRAKSQRGAVILTP